MAPLDAASRLRLALRAQLVHRNALATAVLRVVWTHAGIAHADGDVEGDDNNDEDEDDDDDEEEEEESLAEEEAVAGKRLDAPFAVASRKKTLADGVIRESFLSLQTEKRSLRDYARVEFRGLEQGNKPVGGLNTASSSSSSSTSSSSAAAATAFDPAAFERRKLEVIHLFYQRLQLRLGHQCLRGQIVLVYNKIRRLLAQIPEVRKNFFRLGKRGRMTKYHRREREQEERTGGEEGG